MNTTILRPRQTGSMRRWRTRAAARPRSASQVATKLDRDANEAGYAPGDDIDHAFYIERAKDLRCAAYGELIKLTRKLILGWLGGKRRV